MIDFVFFDAGETLLYPHPSFAELFATVCREQGVDVTAEQVDEVRDRLAPHLLDIAENAGIEKPSLSPEHSRAFWSHLYRSFLRELDIDDEPLVEALYARFSHISTYKLFDDVLPVLEDLRSSGYKLGLISNFDEWLEEMLVELEVGHLFDVTVISGVEGVEKPDVAIYELALHRAAVNPERSVHVGDSPTMDVEPAASTGMHAVLLDRMVRYPDKIDVMKIDSLKELPLLVSKL
jgi:putative hydrolase of the HAD superfamily